MTAVDGILFMDLDEVTGRIENLLPEAIQSQNAEVGYLYRRGFLIDKKKCSKGFLVDVVQAFRKKGSISSRINLQPPPK